MAGFAVPALKPPDEDGGLMTAADGADGLLPPLLKPPDDDGLLDLDGAEKPPDDDDDRLLLELLDDELLLELPAQAEPSKAMLTRTANMHRSAVMTSPYSAAWSKNSGCSSSVISIGQ